PDRLSRLLRQAGLRPVPLREPGPRHPALCAADQQRHHLVLRPGQYAVSLLHGGAGRRGAVRNALLTAVMVAAATGAAGADGAQVFDTSCAFCHQAGGVGVPGQFPRLAGRIGVIASTPDGKAFLPKVLLNGMSGRITADGEPVLGIMPAFDTLSDDDIAAVL